MLMSSWVDTQSPINRDGLHTEQKDQPTRRKYFGMSVTKHNALVSAYCCGELYHYGMDCL